MTEVAFRICDGGISGVIGVLIETAKQDFLHVDTSSGIAQAQLAMVLLICRFRRLRERGCGGICGCGRCIGGVALIRLKTFFLRNIVVAPIRGGS